MANLRRPLCVAPVGDRCGEGAVWHAAEHALFWVDINRFLIHRMDGVDGAVKTWMFDEPVTALTLTDCDDTLVAVFGSKAQLWHPHTGSLGRVLFRLGTWPDMRCNDARVDPRGSLWIGTMRNNVGEDGECLNVTFAGGMLYRIDPDGTVSEWKRDIGLSNTVTWSPCGDRFYFGDTIANAIYAFDFDLKTGAISGERPFFTGFKRGLPDGSTVDSEGVLWNARYDGGCLVAVAPDGSIKEEVQWPVSRPTTCTFGGPDLRTLYVTTADSGSRFSGGLFAIRTDVPGLPENRFKTMI